MLIAESFRQRRLIGRLDRGAEIGASLADVCRQKNVRCAEVRAIGQLENVVVSHYDAKAQRFLAPQRFDSAFELLSLVGNVSEQEGKLQLSAHLTLSRARDSGIELIGGRLVSARVLAVEFVIETMDDLLLRRSRHAGTGLDLWNEAIALGENQTAEVAPASAQAAPSWKEVQAASPLADPGPAETAKIDRRVEAGDFIEHPKFGRCQVERLEGDYEFVLVRLRNQRLIRLSLDVLTFEWIGEESGHQLFAAVAQ